MSKGVRAEDCNIKISSPADAIRRRKHSGSSLSASASEKEKEKENRSSQLLRNQDKNSTMGTMSNENEIELETFDSLDTLDTFELINNSPTANASASATDYNFTDSISDKIDSSTNGDSSSIQMTTFASVDDSGGEDDDDDDDGDYDEDTLLIQQHLNINQHQHQHQHGDDGDGGLNKGREGIRRLDGNEVEIKVLEQESFWLISVQVFIPFLIAGMGMVGAGLVLDVVQHWPVFIKVPEVFILVPALLGLKGNLEMTLASRLSTQANLGNLDSTKSKWQMTLGNLSLVQCQAIVIGFLASVSAVLLGWLPDGHFDMNHALILCTSSVMTASIASFCLGVIMVTVVLVSRYLKINPDNVATPIAASLGDLTTLSLLAGISNGIHGAIEKHPWVAPVILGVYLVSISLWIHLAKQNTLTEKVLYTGWTPVLSAMVISSCGGLILDYTVKTFKGIAVFQPVISGVGGNLVAVQASRISTYLHFHCQLGTLPESIPQICINPVKIFFNKGGHAMTARALILMVIPGHLIFTYTISYIQAGHTSITPVFLTFYLIAALLQVIILLYVAEVLILCLWKNSIDPDNSAIPYLTSMCDLVGTALLATAFFLLYWVGDRDSDVGD